MFGRSRNGPQDAVNIRVTIRKGRPLVKGKYPSKWKAEHNPPATERQFFRIIRHVETLGDRHSELNDIREAILFERKKFICAAVAALITFYTAPIFLIRGLSRDENDNTIVMLIVGVLSLIVFSSCVFLFHYVPRKIKAFNEDYFKTVVVVLNLEREVRDMASTARVRIIDVQDKKRKFTICIARDVHPTETPVPYADVVESKPAIAVDEDSMAQDVKELYP
mmetsp:Transcript_15925/g.17981  ORF Transcript_15925/g.17981 Transcript_15925/m.17981 type:complete len:222 (-) Transcript_15925:14-679(-)|eukprot:CAMPEP_0184006006 /NCGR_PEP_ID=MMETSP0954-20121128/408_1 /TAXON_ID=627963 /ORGANISM="Aplanochytrium sp, Strain PBS07" /LENGTH=221 /DNA_ID=CAMNT_0026284417 /DNA_START=931 /DNA_END=1596 /DNA_ORIENTATION=-